MNYNEVLYGFSSSLNYFAYFISELVGLCLFLGAARGKYEDDTTFPDEIYITWMYILESK